MGIELLYSLVWVKDQENVVHITKIDYIIVLVGQVCHVCLFDVL